MALFSLDTALSHLFHFRENQFGHNAFGNSIVSTIDNVIDPVISSVVSNATAGQVTITPTAPTGESVASATASEIWAVVLQALVSAHYSNNTPVTKAVTPPKPTVVATQPPPSLNDPITTNSDYQNPNMSQ